MKRYIVTFIVASALVISVVVVRQKAQAQNTASEPIRPVSADVTEKKTEDPPAPDFGAANQESPPVFVTQMPTGYRDWRLISVAHEEGNLHSFAAVLGNDVAIKAYREGKLPYPDGTVIAARTITTSIRGKQQSLRTRSIFRSRRSLEHSVHDQGL